MVTGNKGDSHRYFCGISSLPYMRHVTHRSVVNGFQSLLLLSEIWYRILSIYSGLHICLYLHMCICIYICVCTDTQQCVGECFSKGKLFLNQF